MAVKIETIREYAELMKELDLTKLEIEEKDMSICLERGGICHPAPMMAPAAAAAPAPAASAAPAAAESTPSNCYDVVSPMVGVFFAAPSPDAKPYVSVGSKVKKGDVLCIIEAMKLMNEITADADGVVEEICVRNKDVVDCGLILFRIRRA